MEEGALTRRTREVLSMALFLCLVLSVMPASAVTLEDLEYDPEGDVIDAATNQTVLRRGVDILNVRVDDLSGDLEISITLGGAPEPEGSYTVNLLVDSEDLFTFTRSTLGDFGASDPLGVPLAVTGWFDPGRVAWEVSTGVLSVGTGLEISSAFAFVTNSTGATLMDSFESRPPSYDPPVVTIASPSEGAELTGTVPVTGTASGDAPVSKVFLRVDGGEWTVVTGTDTWAYDLDTTALADGSHTIEAKAYDGQRESVIVRVKVTTENGGPANGRPVVRTEDPLSGSTVRGVVVVNGTASDDVAVTSVSVRVNGGDWTTVTGTTEWSYALDTTAFEDGVIRLEFKASDGQLESEVKLELYVVDNVPGSVYPMTTSITHPLKAQAVNGPVNVTGTATPDGGIQNVRVRIDNGRWNYSTGRSSWYHVLAPGTLSAGLHSLEAYAIGWGGARSSIAVGYFWYGDDPPPEDLPPVVTITDPGDGAYLERTREDFTFRGRVFDDQGVDRVEARIIGETEWTEASVSGTSWSLGLDLRPLVPGEDYSFEVRAFDGSQFSASPSIGFETARNRAPTLTYTVKEKDSDHITFGGTAVDDCDPIARVEVSVNGAGWFEASFTPKDGSPYQVVWTYTISLRNVRTDIEQDVVFRAFDGISYSDEQDHTFYREKSEGGMNPKAPGPGSTMALIALLSASVLWGRRLLRERGPRSPPSPGYSSSVQNPGSVSKRSLHCRAQK